jgi:O-antigen ligase
MLKFNNKDIHEKIFYFLILIFSFSIPLWRNITPIIIILLFINWLLEADFKHKFQRLSKKPQIYFFFIFTVFYLVHYLGFINTINYEFARFDIEIKMTFLLFPLLLFSSNTDFIDDKKLIYIFLAYINGCFISFLISILNSLLLFNSTGDLMWFFYVYVSYFYHSSYISMYIIFAIGLICYLLIENKISNKLSKISLYFLLIIFSVYIVVLSSKAGIICLFITSFLVYIYMLSKKKKVIIHSIFFILSLIIIYLGIKSIPTSINRLTPALEAVRAEKRDINMEDGTVQRIEIWKSSLELLRENPILGVGTGDVKDELLRKYDEKGMTFAKSYKLNSHNQYLQTSVALGFIGLLSLILMLLAPLIYAFKNKNYIYFFFLIIVGFSILVESMFENQAGVLFFTFFNTFLFLMTKRISLNAK